MPDIFDQIQPDKAGGGDIFDQVSQQQSKLPSQVLPSPLDAARIAEENARVLTGDLSGQLAPQQPQLPNALQNEQQQIANAPTFQNPRTGRVSKRLPPGMEPGPAAFLDEPILGAQNVGEGASELTREGAANKAEGAAKIVGGGFQLITPVLPGAIAHAPARMAAALVMAGWTDKEVREGLTDAGVDPKWAGLGGKLAAALVGARTAKVPEDIANMADYARMRKAAQAKYNADYQARQQPKQLPAASEPAKPAGDIFDADFEDLPNQKAKGLPAAKGDIFDQVSRETKTPVRETEQAKPETIESQGETNVPGSEPAQQGRETAIPEEVRAEGRQPESSVGSGEAEGPSKPAEARPLTVEESPRNAEARDQAGTKLVNIDPVEFQKQYEQGRGEPLAWSPERAAALRDRDSVDAHPHVDATDQGGVDVTDGRHRIAEAARRGQPSLPVQVDEGTKLPDSVLAKEAAPARQPAISPAYGRDVQIAVPGEDTKYQARYAIREAADVQPSHNPFSFEKNPVYEHQNDRDYSQAGNAARVVEASGKFDPSYVLTDAPTAEHGPTIIDQNGNALGGNNRAMALKRVYGYNPEGAAAYKDQLRSKAQQFGIDPQQVDRFQQPVLTREVTQPLKNGASQKAITDFNKTASAALSPAEQAVADGKRLTDRTVQDLAGRLEDAGHEGTLAQALRGENGAEVVNKLVKDGVITEQQKNGLIDERGHLTPEAKDRIGKALVGRLFESPEQFQQTPPELRGKLERIAPQVMRVEGRGEWKLTEPVREAVTALADAKAHGIKNLDDLAKQTSLLEQPDSLSKAEKAVLKGMGTRSYEAVTSMPDLLMGHNEFTFDEMNAALVSLLKKGRVERNGNDFKATKRQGGAVSSPAKQARYSPEALAIAKKLQEGPLAAQRAFRQYANDEALSREGSQSAFFEPPTRKEAFAAAFGVGDRIPALASRRFPADDLRGSSEDMIARSQAVYRKAPGGKPGWVLLNEPAVVAIRTGLELAGHPDIGDVAGLSLGEGSGKKALAGLRMMAASDFKKGSYSSATALTKLHDTLQAAAAHDPDGMISFARHDEGIPLNETFRALREESHHREGRRLLMRENRAVSLRRVVESRALPGYRAAEARVLSRDPGLASFPEAAQLEIMAAIANREPGRVGLTAEQGDKIYLEWAKSMVKQHGDAALPAVDNVYARYRKELRDALNKKVGAGPGSGGPAGEGDGGVEGALRRPTDPARGKAADQFGVVRNQDAEKQPGEVDVSKPESSGGPASSEQHVHASADQGADKRPRRDESPSLPGTVGRSTSERGSAPMLSDLAGYVAKQFSPDDGPQVNYSGLGSLQDKFVRNLSQLEKANPRAHQAAVRAAASRAQAATTLRAAVPAINKALEGSDFTWHEMRLAMINSRLLGAQERWKNFADQVGGMGDLDLHKAYNEQFAELLGNIEGKRGLPQNLSQTAAALLQPGSNPLFNTTGGPDYKTLREFLGKTFDDAAAGVQPQMERDWFDALRKDPQVKKALGIYKYLVERSMNESHALNDGVFSTALGPMDTYYPLIPLEPKAVGGAGRRTPYTEVGNLHNDFATGLGRFDSRMEALRDSLAASIRANDKTALLKTLESEGLMHTLPPGATGDAFLQDGTEYEGERVEISPARQITDADGRTTFKPAEVGMVPRWLHKELQPILERERPDTATGVKKIMQAINTFALAGPADFVFHSSNLLGTLVANTPFLGDSILGKAASMPVAKRFTAVAKVLSVDATTPESARDLIEMAKLGLVPDKYASVTFSRQAAEELGAEKKTFSFSPALFGPKGIDVRARLVMYRLAKQINPDATPRELYGFVNQLGNYTGALQGEIERSIKASGWAPFYTAGSTMLRNGINAWTGQGPMPKDGIGLRAWQMLTGGAAGTVALWALTHKAYTGKWPWNDKRAKLLQIPVNPEHRHTALGNALWGKTGDVGYLNFGFFNPLVGRGSRALGISGAFEARQLGGSAGQMMEAGQKDVLNSFAHPALGPAAKAAFVGVTGDEPYLTSLRDDRGRMAPQLWNALPKKVKTGLPSIGARAVAAIGQMNSFYGKVGQATGLLPGDHAADKGNVWLRMITDLAAPGLVSGASNPYKKAEGLRKQRRVVGE